jgi:hypothetical protein
MASVGGFVIWWITHENSGFRGVVTYIFHVLSLLIGWLLGKWTGLVMVSLPFLIFFYYFLFHIALVVVPASEPNRVQEWFLRIRYFLWYMWGFQYPAWVVPDPSGRLAETRIKGLQDSKAFAPGFIWAHSHQVVGITTGVTFSRIESPGTVFTRVFERPINGVIDLRTQLRSFWIDVVSSDGIPYKALLFTTFLVDKEKWDRHTLHRLYLEDRLLKDAREPDYPLGSFPFSKLRIRTLLSVAGIRSSAGDPTKKNQGKNDQGKPEPTYWDELVMYQIEKTASEVLSQKRFDELWLPADDYEGACAADGIAQAILDRCSFDLLRWGVRLNSCQVVNFEFTREKFQQPGEVELKQIAAWQADWQRDAFETRAAGKAEAELVQQDARAYAYATLLTAVAEGLQETLGLHPNLPRNLIAMRFVGALEEILQQQPEGEGKREASSAISSLKQELPPGVPRT